MLDSSIQRSDERHSEVLTVLGDIKSEVKDVAMEAKIKNGRIGKLENWSIDAQKVIENNATVLEEYKKDKVRAMTAIAVTFILGGTIITLGLLVVNYKLKDYVKDTFASYNLSVDN